MKKKSSGQWSQVVRSFSNDELSELAIEALTLLGLRLGENRKEVPDAITLERRTENVIWSFDINIDISLTQSGKEAFEKFCDTVTDADLDNLTASMFKTIIKPGEL